MTAYRITTAFLASRLSTHWRACLTCRSCGRFGIAASSSVSIAFFSRSLTAAPSCMGAASMITKRGRCCSLARGRLPAATTLERPIDKHTKQIVASNIETLFNHCVRFYERQFVTREITNRSILDRFEDILEEYFGSDLLKKQGLPTVQYCADKICLSPNYFGDLIKRETGKTATEHIQLAVINKAKEMLAETSKSISEIAYDLGFNYPHHLSRSFKKIVGMTPNEFRLKAVWPPSSIHWQSSI